MEIGLYIIMFVLGACLGSFLCCQARRLRLRDTQKGKRRKKPLGSRSVCLHCRKQLKWYDNLPIASWLILRGKCRYCHKKIGLAEILSELGTGLAFIAVAFGFGQLISSTSIIAIFRSADIINIASFAITLIFALTLIFLAIYDGLYGELPSLCLTLSIICAIITLTLRTWASLSVSPFAPDLIVQPLLATLILGGLYLALYLISKGKWVGDGDWLLGTAIALALGTPWLALITLFLANLTACLVMYPIVKSKRTHKIHFGPFLVIAFFITYAFAHFFTIMI
ncbi:prepilin peptidase [Candidatus Saccharibacteria bacterium]|nr:prepilin peptidase [Candidatus Saccharibacteria bacterium]